MCGSQLSIGALAIFLALPIISGAADSITTELDQKAAATIAAFGVPSASIAVIQDGRLLWAKAFGDANLAADRKADVSTRYAVGSISKQFTAAALLLEQERGKVSLDDSVAKYFPELTRANDVTIRELLSHTSGYEDYAPQDYIIPEWEQPTTPRDILNRWAKKPLNFDPGTRWQYSNTNYVLAGEIRSLSTDNANSYFTDQALSDYHNSLSRLGALQVLIRQGEQLRGGMTHLSYRAHFQNDSVVMNIYILPNGKFEQFLLEEAF